MPRNTTPWTQPRTTVADAVPVLEVTRGAARGRRFPLTAAYTTIGREDADLVLSDSGISRRHAKLIVAADQSVTVMDLGATNGTRVNGVLVSMATLMPGDTLRLGPTAELRLSFDAPKREAADDAASLLSPRQREVAERVAEGLTNAEIADALGISPHTVARHLENIYDRLGVRSKSALVSRLTRT